MCVSMTCRHDGAFLIASRLGVLSWVPLSERQDELQRVSCSVEFNVQASMTQRRVHHAQPRLYDISGKLGAPPESTNATRQRRTATPALHVSTIVVNYGCVHTHMLHRLYNPVIPRLKACTSPYVTIHTCYTQVTYMIRL